MSSNDRTDSIRGSFLIRAFSLGAISGFIAGFAELGLSYPVTLVGLSDQTLSVILMACVIAPLAEELAKPLGLYLLGKEEQPNIPIQHWVVLGMFAGLGFALIEDILYALNVITYGLEASMLLTVLRLFFPLHMIASAFVGFGYGLWYKTKKITYFMFFAVLAMVLHGLFNFLAVIG